MTYTFTPPSTEYSYPTHERLWMFFRSAAHGMSVIRWQDGTYSCVETLTTDEETEASFIYYGGHIYTVSDTEATALTNAGFGSGLTSNGTAAPTYPPPNTAGGSTGGGTSSGGYGSGGYGSGGYGG